MSQWPFWNVILPACVYRCLFSDSPPTSVNYTHVVINSHWCWYHCCQERSLHWARWECNHRNIQRHTIVFKVSQLCLITGTRSRLSPININFLYSICIYIYTITSHAYSLPWWPSLSLSCTSFTCRYLNTATEPDSSERMIMFTVFDGFFSGNDNITLQIQTIDDNPTIVSV